MNEREALARLREDPAFDALRRVYAALLPLSPERRRRVVEAVHGLLAVSAGERRKGK